LRIDDDCRSNTLDGLARKDGFRNKRKNAGTRAQGVHWTTYGEHDVPHTLCVSGHPLPDIGCDLRYFFGDG